MRPQGISLPKGDTQHHYTPVAHTYSPLGRPTGRVHGQAWGQAILSAPLYWPLAFSVKTTFFSPQYLVEPCPIDHVNMGKPFSPEVVEQLMQATEQMEAVPEEFMLQNNGTTIRIWWD